MAEHFKDVAEFVMSDDNSDLGKMKAERDYALHCLEREIAICSQMTRNYFALLNAIERIRDFPYIGEKAAKQMALIAGEAVNGVVGGPRNG